MPSEETADKDPIQGNEDVTTIQYTKGDRSITLRKVDEPVDLARTFSGDAYRFLALVVKLVSAAFVSWKMWSAIVEIFDILSI